GTPFAGNNQFVTLNYGEMDTENNGQNPGWMDGNDGYYYYNRKLLEGETTVDVMKSVTATIPPDLKTRYKGKNVIIDVRAEAIEATKIVMAAAWT
ncbi:MAG: hypothetical protein ACRCZC_02485, partial [Culicoidibacterales bacterium]